MQPPRWTLSVFAWLDFKWLLKEWVNRFWNIFFFSVWLHSNFKKVNVLNLKINLTENINQSVLSHLANVSWISRVMTELWSYYRNTGFIGLPFWSWSKSKQYGIQDCYWKCTTVAADSQLPWLFRWQNAGVGLIFLCFLSFMKSESSEQSGSVMVPLPPGEKESWGAISGTVVLVILVVLLLSLLLHYRHRQRDKQNNTPTVSFSTSRTVNSEYTIPGKVQTSGIFVTS